MVSYTALAVGLGFGASLVLLILALAGTRAPKRPGPLARLRTPSAEGPQQRTRRRAAYAIAAALGIGLWLGTGVFIFGALAGAAVVGVPWLLAPTRNAQDRINSLDALAEWVQRLANAMRAGKGLQQAMRDSRTGAPEHIADQVTDLTERLRAGWRPEDALRALGKELDDVSADKVVAALVLACAQPGSGLATALERHATSVRREVAKRQAIESDRQKSRTTVRWVTIILLAVVAAGPLVPSYTAPYSTLLGQLVLGALALSFVATLVWMRNLATQRRVPRFLVADPASVVTLPTVEEELLQQPVREEAKTS